MENDNSSSQFVDQSNRLIVLIPDYDKDDVTLMQYISESGKHKTGKVLLVAMADCENQIRVLSNRISKFESYVSKIDLEVSSTLTDSEKWLNSLKEIYRPGDTIICQAEQLVIDNHYKSVPIGDFLANLFQATVHCVAGNQDTLKTKSKKNLYELFWLSGFFIIMTLFTWIEIKSDIFFQGSPQTILIMISVVVECFLLWLWYKLGIEFDYP